MQDKRKRKNIEEKKWGKSRAKGGEKERTEAFTGCGRNRQSGKERNRGRQGKRGGGGN